MTSPRVSVLLPTYEPRADFLRDAITSLFSQTVQDWELIVHDDASNADVSAMIGEFVGDNRVTVIKSAARLGIGGNWNAALQYANAPFIQFLFQDDLWEPTYLQESLNTLEGNTSAAFSFTNHNYKNDEGITPDVYQHVQQKREQLQPGLHNGKELLESWIADGLHPNIIGEPPFVMMRRTTMEQAGTFDETMHQGLDSEYWTRLLMHGDCIYLSETLGTFRVHGEAASAVHAQNGKGALDRILMLHRLHAHDVRDQTISELIRARKSGEKTHHGSISKSYLLQFTLAHPILALRILVKMLTVR